jgi:hypothetical protein
MVHSAKALAVNIKSSPEEKAARDWRTNNNLVSSILHF